MSRRPVLAVDSERAEVYLRSVPCSNCGDACGDDLQLLAPSVEFPDAGPDRVLCIGCYDNESCDYCGAHGGCHYTDCRQSARRVVNLALHLEQVRRSLNATLPRGPGAPLYLVRTAAPANGPMLYLRTTENALQPIAWTTHRREATHFYRPDAEEHAARFGEFRAALQQVNA